MVWTTADEFILTGENGLAYSFWADARVELAGLFQPVPEPSAPLALLSAAAVAMRRRP